MIPNIILTIMKYSNSNHGRGITNVFYYGNRGLCNRNTGDTCYNWRSPIIDGHNIFRIVNGEYIQTMYLVPKCIRDYSMRIWE